MASDHAILIEALQRTVEALPHVVLLVLFGSRARGSARADSDVDVAIGLGVRSPEVRRAAEIAFARAVRAAVDVLFLDTAPPQLRFEMARTGVVLFERTEGAWARERARAMVDWWDWAPLARRIHDRAVARLRAGASSLVNRDLVARKLARARGGMTEAAARLDRPRDAFMADTDARDLAIFHLFLAMQEVIDLAAHWIADAGWEPPDDAGAAFDVLAKRGVISVAAATELRAMVGLRKRIAHGYATLDHERLHEEANAGLAAMRAFLVAIADAAEL